VVVVVVEVAVVAVLLVVAPGNLVVRTMMAVTLCPATVTPRNQTAAAAAQALSVAAAEAREAHAVQLVALLA
jgi:hypothetical protein